jgi:hypothetical protein
VLELKDDQIASTGRAVAIALMVASGAVVLDNLDRTP